MDPAAARAGSTTSARTRKAAGLDARRDGRSTTVTATSPTVATSAAPMAARSRPSETNSVGRGWPFQCTTEPAASPVPSTVSVNGSSPATISAGVSEVMRATGSGSGPAGRAG